MARIQFPFNTCPFWFQSTCGFRRNLNDVHALLPAPPAEFKSAVFSGALAVEPVLIERGYGMRESAKARELSSTSTSSYSTASCTSYKNWAFTFFLIWNTQNADDVAAKELFLANFATQFSVTRNGGGSCANYIHSPSSTAATAMCTEVTASANTNWFAWPYAYAPIYVTRAQFAFTMQWFMRNHDSTSLNSLSSFTLPFMVVPNSGCTFYDFEEWSIKSANFTVPLNYYPMLKPSLAFPGTAAVGGTSPDRIKMASTSCSMTGWKLFAPYLYNQLLAWSTGPKFASAFNTALTGKTSTTSSQFASTDYASSTTMPLTTAYYQYSVQDTGITFAKVLKYAILAHTATTTDTSLGIHNQPVVLVRSAGCNDYDYLVYTGHTDAFDWPVNREALSIASDFGGSGRRAALVDAQKAPLQGELTPENLPAMPNPAPEPAAEAVEVLSPAEKARRLAISSCVSAFDTTAYSSWTLHITYVYNNPINSESALTLCKTFATTYTGSCTTAWDYSNNYGSNTMMVLGSTSPVSTTSGGTSPSGLQFSYSYALNVPDSYLSTVLQAVMNSTASTSDYNANLGWFLVPNLYTTANGCTMADLYGNIYMKEEPRPWITSNVNYGGSVTTSSSGSFTVSSLPDTAVSGSSLTSEAVSNLKTALSTALTAAGCVTCTVTISSVKLTDSPYTSYYSGRRLAVSSLTVAYTVTSSSSALASVTSSQSTTFLSALSGAITAKYSTATVAGSSSSSSTAASSTESSTNIGAIVGGVVGGVCGLLLIGGLAWWFFKASPGKISAKKIASHTAPPPPV